MKAKLNSKRTRTCYIPVWSCPSCGSLLPVFGDSIEIVQSGIAGYVSLKWLSDRGYSVSVEKVLE